MTVISDWDTFQQLALDITTQAPGKTRFVTKYRHCDGKLELKVTDDRTCAQYHTDRTADLKRWERLSRVLAEQFSQRSVTAELAAAAAATGEDNKGKHATPTARSEEKTTKKRGKGSRK